MLTVTTMLLAAACISSPAEPGDPAPGPSEPSPPVGQGGLSVAPGQVWLFQGQAHELIARLTGEDAGADSIVFTWNSSDASVVAVDADGTLTAKRPGEVHVNVTASFRLGTAGPQSRQAAVPVTVTSTEQEASIARILGVPRLEPVWSELAYSRRYDELFEQFGDQHWNQTGGEWENTYYDRGLAWFAAWWRTGDAEYFERGMTDIEAYRDDYVLPNDGGVSPQWAFPEGLAVHYVLTGEDASRRAVTRMADRLRSWIDGPNDILETRYRDGRIQGRAILAQLMAYLLTGDDGYRQGATAGVERLIRWFDEAGGDGAWDSSALPWPAEPDMSKLSYCGGMATFQITHALLEAMVRYHDLIDPDPRIVPILAATLDRTWEGHWHPGEGFSYIQPPRSFNGDVFHCDGSGSSRPAKDVSLLILTTFGDAYRLTREERFRTRGDDVLDFGLSGAVFLHGDKQFNQSFMRSYRYLWATG